MRRIYQTLALILVGALAAAVAGCDESAHLGTAANVLVERYCETPAVGRTLLRQTIAAATAPNRVSVECATDAL